MQSYEVTVTATAPFRFVFEAPPSATYAATYDELPKATLQAAGDRTLLSVLEAAAAVIGVRLASDLLDSFRERGEAISDPTDVGQMLVWTGFARPDDDEIEWQGDEPTDVIRRWQQRVNVTRVVVRDAEGLGVWKSAFEATFDELVDAAKAGLVDGDPLRPYLVPSIPQGDAGNASEWLHFVDVLRVLWDMTEAAASIGGAAGFAHLTVQLHKRRSADALRAVERSWTDWSARGAAPTDLFRLLISKDWKPDELGRLLGCTAAEATSILWAFGFAPDESGIWRWRADEAGVYTADELDFAFAEVFAGPGWKRRLKQFARQRLSHLDRTGKPPSRDETKALVARTRDDWLDVSWPDAGRIRRWFDRFRRLR